MNGLIIVCTFSASFPRRRESTLRQAQGDISCHGELVEPWMSDSGHRAGRGKDGIHNYYYETGKKQEKKERR